MAGACAWVISLGNWFFQNVGISAQIWKRKKGRKMRSLLCLLPGLLVRNWASPLGLMSQHHYECSLWFDAGGTDLMAFRGPAKPSHQTDIKVKSQQGLYALVRSKSEWISKLKVCCHKTWLIEGAEGGWKTKPNQKHVGLFRISRLLFFWSLLNHHCPGHCLLLRLVMVIM